MRAEASSRSGRPIELIATLGPASFRLASSLAQAGATAFRINGSHMTSRELGSAVEQIRAELSAMPIVVDLQGAKMRVGRFPSRTVHAGESVRFCIGEQPDAPGAVPVPHPELFRAAQVGELLRCDDDRVRFEVTERAATALQTRSLVDGTLEPRKALNLRDHPVELTALSQADRDQIDQVAHVDRLAFAFSFMKDGGEAARVRARAPERLVIGKIERQEALDALPQIARRVDGLWICRGDLGAQLGQAELPRAVATLDPRSSPVPMIMAGQVLEHLTEHPTPTRAEICHLYDLWHRGFDGFVLSDETAIGADPVGAVKTAAALLHAWHPADPG